jgi:hypothetical protein
MKTLSKAKGFEIWGSHSGYYEGYNLLGCVAV